MKNARARQVAVVAQKHVNHLLLLIDRPVEVSPLPADAHVRLVAPPSPAGPIGRPTPRPRQQRGELLDPLQDRPGGDVDAALRQ
jgi:hypothetical protein